MLYLPTFSFQVDLSIFYILLTYRYYYHKLCLDHVLASYPCDGSRVLLPLGSVMQTFLTFTLVHHFWFPFFASALFFYATVLLWVLSRAFVRSLAFFFSSHCHSVIIGHYALVITVMALLYLQLLTESCTGCSQFVGGPCGDSTGIRTYFDNLILQLNLEFVYCQRNVNLNVLGRVFLTLPISTAGQKVRHGSHRTTVKIKCPSMARKISMKSTHISNFVSTLF